MHLVPTDQLANVLKFSTHLSSSHFKTTCKSVAESIEYSSNNNSTYISLVKSINDENEDETTVSPNCTVTKVDSPVAKSKAYEKNVGLKKEQQLKIYK